MIGSFGDINLEVNRGRQLIMEGLSSSEKANWVRHEVINVKARSEFLKDTNKEYKFSLILRAMNNVNPKVELEKIRNIKENGLIENLILGSEVLGEFYIESFNATYDYIDNVGNIWDIKVDLNLMEYSQEGFQDTGGLQNTTQKREKALNINYETGEVS